MKPVLQGQMVYMAEWDSMLFLACPIMKELNNLVWSGLFINDLRLPACILTASFSAEIQHFLFFVT
jgi:hypothetical protein